MRAKNVSRRNEGECKIRLRVKTGLGRISDEVEIRVRVEQW